MSVARFSPSPYAQKSLSNLAAYCNQFFADPQSLNHEGNFDELYLTVSGWRLWKPAGAAARLGQSGLRSLPIANSGLNGILLWLVLTGS